jgi:hypothetical protein
LDVDGTGMRGVADTVTAARATMAARFMFRDGVEMVGRAGTTGGCEADSRR